MSTSRSSKRNLESWFEQLKRRIQTYTTLLNAAYQTRRKEKREVKKLKKEVANLLDAQAVIQNAAAEIQNTVHTEIAGAVSKCLSTVYDEPYAFHIPFEKRRGKTEARLVFSRDGLEIVDPFDEVGGGVIDIAAFALRLACILRSYPQLRRTILLDEPFKHLDSVAKPIALKLIRELGKQTNTQFIIVTHISRKALKKAGFKDKQIIVVD